MRSSQQPRPQRPGPVRLGRGAWADADAPARPRAAPPARPARPARPRGSWWRRWSWKKALGTAAAGALIAALLVAAAVIWAYEHTPIPTDISAAARQQASTVYFAGGKTQVGTFTTGIDRQVLTTAQIPAVMKNAIIAAEDRHFYTEGGISLTGIARAAFEDLFGSGGLQGGSTITEQFAKNYYADIGTSRSISTKIKEIFVAIKLAHEKSKSWILTQYLNTVAFGDSAYGVGAAARIYFGRPAARLTVAQAAMLAAIVNEPGYLSPDPSAGAPYRALKARWSYVLGNMVRDGALSRRRARAQHFPRVVPGPVNNGWAGNRGYIMQAVQNELETTYRYTRQQIDTSGLKIVTTFSRAKMNALYQTIAQETGQLAADGTPLPYYAHVGAVLEKPGSGAILAMYGGPSYTARDCKRLDCEYNMALTSRNLVGSSFKPYVLATAVREGMNVGNSVINGTEPMCVPPDTMPLTLSLRSVHCPPGYFPVDIAGENLGPLSVARATALSSDPGFEDLIHRAGTRQTVAMARAFGVDIAPASQGGSGLVDKLGQVGMALGTASLTVEEQATTFATLADGGVYYTPHVIARLSAGGRNIPIKVSHRRVLSPAQAADVDYALSFDTVYGTAYPNGVLSPARPTIGKTGTTDQAQSAFFIGAIPQYSLAVGMFTNSQNELPGGQTLNLLASVNGQAGGYGGAWPATIWRAYMQRESAGLPVLRWPAPDFAGFTRWVQVRLRPRQKAGPAPGRRCARRPGGQHGHPCPAPAPSCPPGRCASPPPGPPLPPGPPGHHRGHGRKRHLPPGGNQGNQGN